MAAAASVVSPLMSLASTAAPAASRARTTSVCSLSAAPLQHDIDIINVAKHQLIRNHEKTIDYEEFGPNMQGMLDEVP